MSTKEVAVKRQEKQNDIFNWPLQMDWLDEFMPRRWFSNSSDWNSIKIEEYMKDGKLVIKAEMPGIDPDKDLAVSIHDGYLTISGEREETFENDHRCEFTYGSFSRSLLLPQGYKDSSIKANYKHGILEITMDVPTKNQEGRKIQIEKS